MHSAKPTLLLTGFGPFPRVSINATSVLVPKLAREAARRFAGLEVLSAIVPTEWTVGTDAIARLYREHRPSVAIHFGVSSRASGFAIETRAQNRCIASPDAAGQLPAASCISASGPEFLPVNLPAAATVQRLRRSGLPAQLSRDAGGYLCNAALYTALTFAHAHGRPSRIGFVHVPDRLIDLRRPHCESQDGCRLSRSEFLLGGLIIIATALGRSIPANTRVAEQSQRQEWRASC
jgi:pyroglutamyl-peptidase